MVTRLYGVTVIWCCVVLVLLLCFFILRFYYNMKMNMRIRPEDSKLEKKLIKTYRCNYHLIYEVFMDLEKDKPIFNSKFMTNLHLKHDFQCTRLCKWKLYHEKPLRNFLLPARSKYIVTIYVKKNRVNIFGYNKSPRCNEDPAHYLTLKSFPCIVLVFHEI